MLRTCALTALAMTAFAANSLLCRFALRETDIDPASFTVIRLLAGAAILVLIVRVRGGADVRAAGDWFSAAALFVYALAFSYAYVTLSAGTGALLLFGAVQATMILTGLWHGDRLGAVQTAGLALALGGLVALLLPGATAPAWGGASLMLLAGAAWGVYSLRGRGQHDPIATTAGNFLRAAPLVLLAGVLALPWARFNGEGTLYAMVSGALASGLGYAVWYAALRGLAATSAATVQLSVPVLTAVAGALWLAEPITLRLVLASAATLGGIALVIRAVNH